jgi:hypothetical protein
VAGTAAFFNGLGAGRCFGSGGGATLAGGRGGEGVRNVGGDATKSSKSSKSNDVFAWVCAEGSEMRARVEDVEEEKLRSNDGMEGTGFNELDGGEE